jgi:hypothetical protein
MVMIAVFWLAMIGLRSIRASMGTSMSNPFTKLTKAQFTLIDPQIRSGKGIKFKVQVL